MDTTTVPPGLSPASNDEGNIEVDDIVFDTMLASMPTYIADLLDYLVVLSAWRRFHQTQRMKVYCLNIFRYIKKTRKIGDSHSKHRKT